MRSSLLAIPALVASAVLASKASQPQLYWRYFTLDTTFASYSKIMFDSKDQLKVAFRGHYDIRYASFNGSTWDISVADTGAGTDARVDMALDKADRPHIIHQQGFVHFLFEAKSQVSDEVHPKHPK